MLKKYVFCVTFVTCFLNNFVSTESVPKWTHVDLIIQGLEDQVWFEEETKCLQDTLLILNNVKNHTLWAVWIWNSIQYPTGTFYGSRYSLGNYDQCMKAPSVTNEPGIRTQYCLADIKLTGDEEKKTEGKYDVSRTTDDYLRVKNQFDRHLNIITWGTCLPATCSPGSVVKILKTMYLVNPLTTVEPFIEIDNCQIAGENTVYSSSFCIFVAFCVTLVISAIISTIYLQNTNADTKLTRIAYSFSLKRNWSSFARVSGDDIPSLSYIKTLQVIVTTTSHSFVFVIMAAISNGLDFDYLISRKESMPMNMIQHLDLPVAENFLIISGILAMKSLMEKKKDPFISLIQRYIRLIGSLAFLVFYTMTVAKYTGDGPLWNKLIGKEQKLCEENWIWSILMVNNYVKTNEICQLVTWYVPCDFQLAVIATVLYCIWQWNNRVGKFTTILATYLALMLPGVITYWRRLPGLLLHNIEHMIDFRSNQVYQETYVRTHNRAGAYFIGMAMGYIMTVYKPAKYRGVISKEWSYVGFAVASIISIEVWTSGNTWCLGDYNAWNSAVYAALNRNIWAIATCIYIGVIEYGDIPKLQSIIAWPGFVIFSRLGYGIYITHSLIMQRNFFSQRNPMHHDILNMIITGLGVLVASMIGAILLWLFVEAPLSNLTNLILNPRKQIAQQTQTKIGNATKITDLAELKNRKHS